MHRWSIFEPDRTLRQVLDASAARFVDSDHLQWDERGNLSASSKGLPVIDSILPALIGSLVDFYQNIKSSMTCV